MGCGSRSLVGRVYRSKRWAKRWARGRPVRKVKGGWQICRGKKKIRRGPRRKKRRQRRSSRFIF